MPQNERAAYLRQRAVDFRRLAEGHGQAGNHQISAKMREVAADFDAQAADLVMAAAFTALQGRIEAVGQGITDLEALAAAERNRAPSVVDGHDPPSPRAIAGVPRELRLDTSTTGRMKT